MRWRIKLLAFAVVVAGGATGAASVRAGVGDPVYCCKSANAQCCGTGGCAISGSGCVIIGQPAPGPPPSEA